MEKLNVAIIGQGRSGRDIHGRFFRTEKNTICDVVAVVEMDEARRELALKEYPGCRVYADYRELFGQTDIDLVVNASFSDQHYPITKDLLQHGFNVVVEKPMARNYYECCDMIKTAKENNVLLAVFQQSFLAPYYAHTKAIADSGKLGEIKQVSIHFNGFGRRWDWQTLQWRLGGSVYNTGPHPIGFALGILDFSPDARVEYSKLDLAKTSGDAEDYAKIIMSAPGKPVVDVEISSMDAYSNFNLKFQGTRGTLEATTTAYKLKYYTDEENPIPAVQAEPLKNAEGNPMYCGEKLICHEESGEFKGTGFNVAVDAFYQMVYNKLKNDAPMEVTPEMAARIINVIETVHGQNPLPVLY